MSDNRVWQRLPDCLGTCIHASPHLLAPYADPELGAPCIASARTRESWKCVHGSCTGEMGSWNIYRHAINITYPRADRSTQTRWEGPC